MIGIEIKPTIGVGDALQFSSLPENYFRATGERLVDVNKPWFFDHNPFVIRDAKAPLEKTVQLWNFSPKQFDWPVPRQKTEPQVYLSNAEIWASVLKVPAKLNRPRLYRFETAPFHTRKTILLHTDGRSHGEMPREIVDHVVQKYGPSGQLWQIGLGGKDYGLPRIKTETLWELAEVIAHSRMLIGVDSGPSWIAACFPDVVVKKIRTKPTAEHFGDWIPLAIGNIHSHWDDRCHQIFNPTDEDIGFTSSYRKI